MEISRRKFLKLAGTASLTAIFGLSLTGCVEDDNNITKEEDNSKDYKPLADNKKYFEAKEHHFYIEVSTETNGETSYYEENVSQTSNFIPVKGGRAGSERISGRSSNSYNRNNQSHNNYNTNKYYGSSNTSISNDFTRGLIFGTIIIGSTTLLYGNTKASAEESQAIDIPDGYEVTNFEELKNDDYVYGYKIHFENTVPIETHGFEDENGNVTYPYPGEKAEVKSQGAVYVKKRDEITI